MADGDHFLKRQVPYRRQHQVASYECDSLSRMRLVSLLLLLQEAAELHAASLGFGYDFCVEHETGWVQLSLELEILALPSWKDIVELRTCSAGLGRLIGLRDYEVFAEDASPLVRGTSHWALISMKSRRPLPLGRLIQEMPLPPEYSLGIEQRKLEALSPEGSKDYDFVAQNEHIDMNGHVNHAVYVSQAINALSDEFLSSHVPHRVSLNFTKEMLLGQLAIVRSRCEGLLSEHTVLLDGDKAAAHVRIEWRCLTLSV